MKLLKFAKNRIFHLRNPACRNAIHLEWEEWKDKKIAEIISELNFGFLFKWEDVEFNLTFSDDFPHSVRGEITRALFFSLEDLNEEKEND